MSTMADISFCTFGQTGVLETIIHSGQTNYLELVKNETDDELLYTTTIILRDETKQESLPAKAHGYVLLKDDYERLLPAKNGNDNITYVGVSLRIDGFTRIDSKKMTVGLEVGVILTWKDERIQWPKGKPNYGESFLLDPSVLRFLYLCCK